MEHLENYQNPKKKSQKPKRQKQSTLFPIFLRNTQGMNRASLRFSESIDKTSKAFDISPVFF